MSQAVLLALSEPDSTRFGMRILRGSVSQPDDRTLLAQLLDERADIAILRVPAGSASSLQRLRRFGMHTIHADTLVYYAVDLARYEPLPLRNADLEFSTAQDADRPLLSALVANTFEGYVSHYHANPYLDNEAILAGYRQWAEGFIKGRPDQIVFVARRGGQIVAFACCSHAVADGTCEGVLYGVHPEHAGGGIYGDLIRYTQRYFKERGCIRMDVSTQIWNLAVQKVWAREGFILDRAYDTLHINSLLHSGTVVVDRDFTIASDTVRRFADVSGDANPVHFDDTAARASGFKRRITHGMIVGAELSRIFGTENPGFGTLFLRNELAFIHPLYVDTTYRLRVRILPRAGRFANAVATVENATGDLHVVAYSDLLRPH